MLLCGVDFETTNGKVAVACSPETTMLSTPVLTGPLTSRFLRISLLVCSVARYALQNCSANAVASPRFQAASAAATFALIWSSGELGGSYS
jgi:hypothetical protein